MNPAIPLANSLHRATADALRRQAPFSTMAEHELLWLVQHLSVSYFPHDAVLLEPVANPPEVLFIIKQGTVTGATAVGQTVLQLGQATSLHQRAWSDRRRCGRVRTPVSLRGWRSR